jgi:DNA-directed RNA polymerase specialized sigma24 family protein
VEDAMNSTPAPAPPIPDAQLTAAQAPEDTHSVVDANDDDERRRAILADPEVHETMRGAIRKCGVPADQVDDVLQDTLADFAANLSRLPADPTEGRRYLCGAAHFHSIDNANDRKKERQWRGAVSAEDPDTRSLSPELAVHAHRLAELARKLFPVESPWFFRHKIHGETHAEIGEDAHRSPETVRHKVAEIGRALARSDGAKLGLVTLLVFVAVYFGVRHGPRTGRDYRHDLEAYSATPSVAPPTPEAPVGVRPDDAIALRARGQEECAKGQWDLCVYDLSGANVLDRAGETPELAKLLDHALDKVDLLEAKPGDRPSPHRHTAGSQRGDER